jgi:hypothetical protein
MVSAISTTELEEERRPTEEEEAIVPSPVTRPVRREERRAEPAEEVTPTTAPEEPKVSKPKTGGRRAALRIIRESVEGLSKELGDFRKNHDTYQKRLEKQVSSLKNDLAALKNNIIKETARLRQKQDALSSKVVSQLRVRKAPTKARSVSSRTSTKRKSASSSKTKKGRK